MGSSSHPRPRVAGTHLHHHVRRQRLARARSGGSGCHRRCRGARAGQVTLRIGSRSVWLRARYGGDGESGVHNGETETKRRRRSPRGRDRAERGRVTRGASDTSGWVSRATCVRRDPSPLGRRPRPASRPTCRVELHRLLRSSSVGSVPPFVNSVTFATSCSRPPQLLGSRSDDPDLRIGSAVR